MKKVVIIGGGKEGTALLEVLAKTNQLQVIGVVDKNPVYQGGNKCERAGILQFAKWEVALEKLASIDVVIEATGDYELLEEIRKYVKDEPVTVIPSSIASILFYLLEEKEGLIKEVKTHNEKINSILQSTHDGMIAIDIEEKFTLLNKRAEEITGFSEEQVLGVKINNILRSSELPRVLKTKKIETNRKQIISKDLTIVTTRVPMFNGKELIGALAVFKDITEIEKMAEEVTSLKSIQTMLEAIIHSSNDAISVVDESGKGVMINPAYTRITGLTKDQVVGMPASTDISEGESVHMKVLKRTEAIRGTKMKVGPLRKDVIVNVAPVIVDNQLKGSVAVIHDMSEMQELTYKLEKAKRIIRTLEAKYTFKDIIGDSAELQFAIEQAKLAAITPATILLRGESGTGKELFAHAIHNESNRKYNKFIRVNCAAISETLLESELFGYEDGAFSGAKRGGKKGLFQEADQGSIFLDEIGEVSANMQAKLLRVLQEQEIVRVGGTTPIPIDVRIIAATNVNIEMKMINQTFRADLFYRLNRMPIFIPSLRERKNDLYKLSLYLISKLNQDYGRNIVGMTMEALEKLMQYEWPGNIRELENILGRAIIHMGYTELNITEAHLPILFKEEIQPNHQQETVNIEFQEKQTLQHMMDKQEEKILLNALNHNSGNKTNTAKMLGISIRNLYYKLDKYGIK
ncbi:sigma-54-dependent Fis family transcriptional regulator [Salipaludibacillus neizhouensis]|uniref:Sigma-54-dependent Fis family transcriptional regulator n=1 Tax=Salipaludibacillus neizhouensis TaxID=885475 RepID=A0A3A9K6Z8_9BACI|nr:sigma 54-interacting transcriptional regulator [Salipaludibacillus neizhouensis]RKL68784.1 sigma-54-dependent Fis family transcriptional regulator [Salipaludibacillus neizhouensis]